MLLFGREAGQQREHCLGGPAVQLRFVRAPCGLRVEFDPSEDVFVIQQIVLALSTSRDLGVPVAGVRRLAVPVEAVARGLARQLEHALEVLRQLVLLLLAQTANAAISAPANEAVGWHLSRPSCASELQLSSSSTSASAIQLGCTGPAAGHDVVTPPSTETDRWALPCSPSMKPVSDITEYMWLCLALGEMGLDTAREGTLGLTRQLELLDRIIAMGVTPLLALRSVFSSLTRAARSGLRFRDCVKDRYNPRSTQHVQTHWRTHGRTRTQAHTHSRTHASGSGIPSV